MNEWQLSAEYYSLGKKRHWRIYIYIYICENVGTKITRIHIESSDIHHSFTMPHRLTNTVPERQWDSHPQPSKRSYTGDVTFYLMAHTHLQIYMIIHSARFSAAADVVSRSMPFLVSFGFRAGFHKYSCLAEQHKTEHRIGSPFFPRNENYWKKSTKQTTRKCAVYFDSLFGFAHE